MATTDHSNIALLENGRLSRYMGIKHTSLCSLCLRRTIQPSPPQATPAQIEYISQSKYAKYNSKMQMTPLTSLLSLAAPRVERLFSIWFESSLISNL